MKTLKGLQPTFVYVEARKRLKELKSASELISSRIQKAPHGKILIVRGENWVQYYLRMSPTEKRGKYLPKKETAALKRYLQKSYDEKVFKIIQKEMRNLDLFLRSSENFNRQIQLVYSDFPGDAKELVAPVDITDEDFVMRWQEVPFTPNPLPNPSTEFETDRGEFVRSKSELNIANALNKAGIPYRYEAPVFLKSGTFYPDFTILVTQSRKEIYWEHRGMMDNSEYARRSVRKLKDYAKSGINVGQNLLITEETSMIPLGTDEIAGVIRLLQSM